MPRALRRSQQQRFQVCPRNQKCWRAPWYRWYHNYQVRSWCLCWINLLITGFLLVPRECSSICNNTPLQECLVCLSWQIWGKGNSHQVWVFSLCFMINRGMIICNVISLFFRSWCPIVSELFLWFPVSEPPQFHIRRFVSFVDYCFVFEYQRCWVVCLDRCPRLWSFHFN